MSILLISNHNSFQVHCDKTASIYFIRKIYIYFSIGNGQPIEPALCLNVWFKTAVETCQLSVLSVWRWCRCAAQPALSRWCSDADGWLWRCSLLHRSASAACCTQLTCSTLVQWTRATRRLLGCSRRCSHWRCPRRCNTVAVDATFTCHTETDFTFLLKL